MIFKRLQRSFGFEIESIMDSNESGCFLLAILNLKQYIIIKINALIDVSVPLLHRTLTTPQR
jgi:hypothetical protein